jgi:hypothetical protein
VSDHDPSQLRISDDDRHRVAEILRQAAGEGRLDLTELDERLEQAYAAKTYADLVPITVDLPTQPGAEVPMQRPSVVPTQGGPRYDSSLAIMSSQSRRGEWELGPTHSAFSLMGEVTLDLRQAHFTSQEVVINANSLMGAVTVIVNARTRVLVEGTGIMGDFTEARPRVAAEIGPHSPTVRVRGFALMAGVSIVRRRMPGEEPRRFLGLGR